MQAGSELPPRQAMIGAWTLSRYVVVLRWPALALSLVLMASTAVGLPQLVTAVIEVIGLAGIGYWLGQRQARRTEALASGVMVGLFVGLATALGRLLHAPSAVLILNLISETILTMLIAGLLTASGYLIRSLFRS